METKHIFYIQNKLFLDFYEFFYSFIVAEAIHCSKNASFPFFTVELLIGKQLPSK